VTWTAGAEQTLEAFCAMVPETVRELAESAARAESEQLSSERGAQDVEPDDVVRGWIRTTPPEQRNGLVAVIDDLGFDPELFADELQSEEGWPEDDDSEL